MRFQHQTQFVTDNEGKLGNCFFACLCSLLDVDLASAPIPTVRDEMWRQFRAFALLHGYRLIQVSTDGLVAWGLEDATLIAGGLSPRQPFEDELISHAVLWRNGEVVFDPHPDGTGLDGEPHTLYFLTPEPTGPEETR